MSVQKTEYPVKGAMNLYYKPDRTTKPATIALYVLFVMVCLLGLAKVLVYDIWSETREAQRGLERAEEELTGILLELSDYNAVREKYYRYAATTEEQAIIDRMEVLDLLDSAVGAEADMDILSISKDMVQIRFSGVTLAQTARIVRALEESPIVERTTVNTAATTAEGEDLVQANVLIQLVKEAEK